jgi:hypothetical protein
MLLSTALFAQGDPHEGQPDTCSNHSSADAAHQCECWRATDCPTPDENGNPVARAEDPKCKVYCRKDHCHCVGACQT